MKGQSGKRRFNMIKMEAAKIILNIGVLIIMNQIGVKFFKD